MEKCKLWSLAIQESLETQNRTVPSLNAHIYGYFEDIVTRVWLWIFLMPRLSENGHFTSYRGQLAVYYDYIVYSWESNATCRKTEWHARFYKETVDMNSNWQQPIQHCKCLQLNYKQTKAFVCYFYMKIIEMRFYGIVLFLMKNTCWNGNWKWY
jgi:hypothetical protein